MDDAIDASIIKTTQDSLGKYVKRPPLTDKLLKKPPFRFLHDIITSVLKSTGFFSGLFDDVELVSDNVKDRESKIVFLTKVIAVVGSTTGRTLTVKPSKIVAGQEPEKTNELLQCLAFALDKKLSSDDAVKLYKISVNSNASVEKKTKEKVVKKATDTKKLTSKSTEKLTKSDKNINKTRSREISTIKKDSPPKKATQSSKIINKKVIEKEKQEIIDDTTSLDKISNSQEITNESKVTQNSEDTTVATVTSNLKINNDDENSLLSIPNVDDTKDILEDSRNTVSEEADKAILEEKIATKSIDEINRNTAKDNKDSKNDINNHYPTTEHDFNNTILEPSLINNDEIQSQNKLITNNLKPEANVTETKAPDISYGKRPNSVRPSSSRPGAPRFRDKHDLILSTVDNVVVGKVNIIAENTTNEEEEESSIVFVDNTEQNLKNENEQLQITTTHHGHLVQQILNSQKEFTENNGKTTIEWQFGVQKARDVVNQEIEELRFNVQAVSRVANPLGKLLDHILEDVEIMRQELQQWTRSYEEASKQLLKQKEANKNSLLPLYSKVKQLEGEIGEKYDKISDLKIVIHKNALRIEKLLASGNVQ